MATRPKPTRPTFGQTMRKLREDRGMTRRELEDASTVSQRQIEYLENDEKDNPKRSTIEALAKVLGPDLLEAAFPGLLIASGSAPKRRNKPDERSVQERSEDPSAAVSAPAWAA